MNGSKLPGYPHDFNDDNSDDFYQGLPDEIRTLVKWAFDSTARMFVAFHGLDVMKDHLALEVYELCWSLRECLSTIPETRHQYLPPPGSRWGDRRAVLVSSLRRNLHKYIRLSQNLSTKLPCLDKFRCQLDKLLAYRAKFSHLSTQIKASTEKMRLMQLRDMYEASCQRLRERYDAERKKRYEYQKAYFTLKGSRYGNRRPST